MKVSNKKLIGLTVIATGLFLLLWLSIPTNLFDDPYSTAVFSSDSTLIGAHIAGDGQWRFGEIGRVPYKFEKSLLTFEDKRFYYHPGFDIISIVRAIIQNIKAGKIVSGASTISMQTIRLSTKTKNRNVLNKIKEIFLATGLEIKYSKKEILNLYCSHAPFGGNVIGLDAASWRYFNLPPEKLTWAQSALLAVLPNSPGLIHPGANRETLKEKRDFLLEKLFEKKLIDSSTYKLSIVENIPVKPVKLPEIASHLTQYLSKENGGGKFYTNIDIALQQQNNRVVKYHQNILRGNDIFNIAVIVIRNRDGAVLSYIGNTSEKGNKHNNYVDMIRAGRSGGSILKPFLYASAMEKGTVTPYQLLPDIPVNINGYNPENYSRKYNGAVTIEQALSRSLNIPAVILLKRFGIQNLINRLKSFGFTTIYKTEEYYGLPLILGAPDVKMWELAGAYSSFARILNDFNEKNSLYFEKDISPPVLLKKDISKDKGDGREEPITISASSIYQTFNIMTKVERPDEEGNWEEFYSQRKIAWKTGTSFGLKDAWSVGVSKDFAVGVWVGNSTGKGRPGLVGVKVAAPVLFDVFNKLPDSGWFDIPYDDMKEVAICKQSGYLAGENCEDIDTFPVCLSAKFSELCPFHKVMLTDSDEKFLIKGNCKNNEDLKVIHRFVLPPKQEYYYKKTHPQYKGMPKQIINCESGITIKQMEFIYPNEMTKVIIPKDFDGKQGKVVFKIAHRAPSSIVYWHIDNKFVKETKDFHNIECWISPGRHVLTVIDENGERLDRIFKVVNNSG